MINIQLLGGLDLEAPDVAQSARSRRRHPLALLAVVAEASPQAVSRDRLMALLWPESVAERASNSLRQALFWLRRDLGEDVFLPESASGLQLDPARVRVDLWTFREALARNAPAEAVAAYRGPFLEGFQLPGAADFAEWADAEQAKLARAHLAALDALARQSEEAGRHDEAVQWRRRQAAADPYSSRSALALLKALVAAGDRPGALEYASVYETMVRTHLEAAPDPAVLEFVASLRRLPDVRPATAKAPAAAAEPVSAVARAPRKVPLRWVVAGAAAVILTVMLTFMLTRDRSTTQVLSSGSRPVGGRDPATRLIACEGPACPAGSLPQDAFAIAKHEFYATPLAGSGYIAPVADATISPQPGYACCTTATFERVFRLPREAIAGRIIVSILADNQARVSVNDVEFGSQPEPLNVDNYSEPSTFTHVFPPDPSGVNRLRITLWDGGGSLGLHYHATVSYDVAAPASK